MGNPGKGVAPSLDLGVVAIEKVAFGLPSATVSQPIYLLIDWDVSYQSTGDVGDNRVRSQKGKQITLMTE